MPGVRTAIIDFDAKEARVTFDAKTATIEQMTAALEKVGFNGSLKAWAKP